MAIPTVNLADLPKVTAAQMQQLIMLATGKYALDTRVLVEHTGRNTAELVQEFAPEGPVLVVAGRGNNGSGGLAAARILASRGRRVWVVPTHEAENYSGTPSEQLELLRHYPGVRVRSGLPKMNFSCVIDAAIGTHLEGPPRGRTLDFITVMNNMKGGNACVISLDVPTGMMVDDGGVPGGVVTADMTLSVALPKRGVLPGGHVGRLFIGDLGLPPALFSDLGLEPVQFESFLTEAA
jgi:NAD(P)H-hydrate epimerase